MKKQETEIIVMNVCGGLAESRKVRNRGVYYAAEGGSNTEEI